MLGLDAEMEQVNTNIKKALARLKKKWKHRDEDAPLQAKADALAELASLEQTLKKIKIETPAHRLKKLKIKLDGD